MGATSTSQKIATRWPPPAFSPINTIMKYNARKLVQSMLCEKLFLILATNTLCSTHDLEEARMRTDAF